MADGKYNTGSSFDEYFINAFQFQQELNEKKAQRIQDINFKMRELSLLDDYRQGVLEDRAKRTEVAKERTGIMSDDLRLNALTSGFIPVTGNQPTRENIRTGSQETDAGGLVKPIIDIGGYQYTYPEPQAPKQIQTKDPRVGANGNVYRWDENTKKYIDTGLKDYNAITNRINATKKDGGGKEPKLTESASDGLAFLKNPVFQKGQGKNLYALTPEEVANKFSESINAITKDVLDARASNWFNNIVRQFGRIPTAAELDNEILKHGEGKEFTATLTETEIGQLNRLVEYLEGAESGIKKIENYIKQ